MADWATISSLATAGGTLILAIATFGSVRSANRAARTAERSLLAGIRPLLVTTRLDDPYEKVSFVDGHRLRVDGGRAVADVTDEAIYLAMSLRNVGPGIAVLDRWSLSPDRLQAVDDPRPLESFNRLTRDLYIPAGGTGFWQGALRDPDDPLFAAVRAAVEERRPMTVDIAYGDSEGTQHMISRFSISPQEGADGWLTGVARHWHLDRDDPR